MNEEERGSADILVIGAGISGLSFARQAALSGKRVQLLEAQERIGGCIYSRRFEDGYWFELGAHTVYNSYTGLLDIVRGAAIGDKLVQRGSARLRFGLLKDDRLDIMTPKTVFFRLNLLESALNFPLGIFRSKREKSVAQYFGGLVGAKNFARVLSPFFAAVPSQCADGFPAAGPGSLFKKRPRDNEFPRSFGFAGGLQTVCDAASNHPNINVRTGVRVVDLRPLDGGFEAILDGGDTVWAEKVAVALPVGQASTLLAGAFPELSAALGKVDIVSVDSLGARIASSRCAVPICAFIVPAQDSFFSAVTRDPFPDPTWRGVAMHFRPGIGREEKIDRMARLLEGAPEDLDGLTENRVDLPSPQVDHAEIVENIQGALEKTPLALTGNYFGGLAIEDCISRSFNEWQRIVAN